MLIFMDYNIFGFLSDMGNPDIKLMFAIFVVFIIIVYKALGVLKNAVIVSVISACFPFVLDKVLGFDVDITVELILFYVLSGVVLYLLYEVFKVIYKSSKVIVSVFKILMFPFVLVLKFLGWLFGFGGSSKKNGKVIVKEKEYKVISEEKEEHKKVVEEKEDEHEEVAKEKKKEHKKVAEEKKKKHDETVKEKKEKEHRERVEEKKKKHDEEEE